jgi:DNA-binding ferritin-like protein (Dps family)
MVKKYLWILLVIVSFASSVQEKNDQQAMNEVLDTFHQAAAKQYLNLLSNDAIFLSTDASERWNKKQLQTLNTSSSQNNV